MAKILCIDDTPDEILPSGKSLKETISNIFQDTPYQVIFKQTDEEGIKIASEDSEIKLILLDVKFGHRIEGPRIADELKKKAPQAKIIVLTIVDDKGNKRTFKWKPNYVKYFVKKNLSNDQQKLKNLSQSIIEDYENKNWKLEYLGSCMIKLSNQVNQEEFDIKIPSSVERPLIKCMSNPNKPVLLPSDQGTANLSKVHHTPNELVFERTEGKTWGILSRDGCQQGQLKLVIGSVVPTKSMSEPEDFYVLQSQFTEFKKAVEARLDSIEKSLNIKMLNK